MAEPTASGVFCGRMLSMVNSEDVNAIIQAQRHMLDRFEKTNEMLINFNGLSNVRLQQMNEHFLLHTRTLVEMKKDLDSIFRRIRTLKGKIAKQYPDAFSNIQSPILEDDDDEFGPVPRSVATTIVAATSEQSTESCDTSPDVISPTVSRCSEDLSQEPSDTPTSDVLDTSMLRDEGPDSSVFWKMHLNTAPTMRRLTKKKALTLVKELDAFPKVPESYVESTASGGTVSLIAFTLMAVLAFLEFFVYRNTWMRYEYEVDKDFSRCQYLGADVLDLAETMIASDGLKYEAVNFELSPEQRLWHMTLLHIQERLRVEHSLQDVLFKSALKGSRPFQQQSEDSTTSLSACRIHGHLYVNKVAGNFHITVGKSIPHPRGHAHLAALVSHDSYNFSHRIDHLSFGEEIPGIINPLDGTEKVTTDANHMFQYFVTIVPTKLNTYKVSADTHQYSVTERDRAINHAAGSHGVSGIFMKYDINSLMVKVTEQHMPLWQFLVRLCGIIGGIFSTTGMLHSMVGYLVDVVCCRFQMGAYRHLKEAPLNVQENGETSVPTENNPQQ
ncbi:hypothetical protein INR49_021550 [Caranx melampygus]|nr:hypothetical protein INR49_021550 [Caranx melampygus]